VRLVPPDELDRLESHLGKLLARRLVSEHLPDLTQALHAYVLAGGKRVRPQLCLWTFQRCAPAQPTTDCILDLACAWELFHAFLLAHDDIIDSSATRRSQPSLHYRLASLDSGSEAFGVNLAIVGGDLLFTAALSLLHDLDLPQDRYRRVLQLFSRVAATTGLGQAIDIVQGHVPLPQVREEELLLEYHWKTAAYTFEGPMLSGALAAGAPQTTLDALSQYSLSLGQAYQIQNDLIDLQAPAHEGCDLVQGKRTITLLRARAGAAETGRQEFDARLARITVGGPAAIAEAEIMRQDLLASPAATRTRELVASLLEQALTAANTPTLPPSLRNGLHDILAGLRSAYFR
jgi:geranylgeranyl diphosphate synthase, type I